MSKKRFVAAMSGLGMAEVIDTALLEPVAECSNMARAEVLATVLNDAIGWCEWSIDGRSEATG